MASLADISLIMLLMGGPAGAGAAAAAGAAGGRPALTLRAGDTVTPLTPGPAPVDSAAALAFLSFTPCSMAASELGGGSSPGGLGAADGGGAGAGGPCGWPSDSDIGAAGGIPGAAGATGGAVLPLITRSFIFLSTQQCSKNRNLKISFRFLHNCLKPGAAPVRLRRLRVLCVGLRLHGRLELRRGEGRRGGWRGGRRWRRVCVRRDRVVDRLAHRHSLRLREDLRIL